IPSAFSYTFLSLLYTHLHYLSFFFFFNPTATPEIYTLSLHDALPISAGNRNASPRRTHAPGPGDRQPHLRHPPFETDGGFRRYTARLGAALPQRRFRSAGSQASPGPWTVARHQPATGQPHRTPEAREPASH